MDRTCFTVAMKPLPMLSVALVVTLLASGLAILNTSEPVEASILTNFTSEGEMRYFVTTHAEQQGGTVPTMDGRSAATIESGSYSRTNVQVEGVDESDLVKTDGSTVFLAEGNQVHLIATLPSLSELSDVVIGSRDSVSVQGLYLEGGRLAVIYSVYDGPSASSGGSSQREDAVHADVYWYPYYIVSRTCINVYDVTDPSDPSLVLSGGMSGSLASSRMAGGVIYLITHQCIWSGDEIVSPQVTTGRGQESVAATSISYDPSCRSVSSFVNLLAFDVNDGKMGNLSTLATSSSVCYMSPTSLYITMPSGRG